MGQEFASIRIQYGFWTEYATNTSYILVSENVASIMTIIVAIILWLSLLRSHEVIRRSTLFICGAIAGKNDMPDADIVMQDFSTNVTVAAIASQVLSEEKAPEKMLVRILKDYVFINTIRLPTATTQFPGSRRRWHNAATMFKKNPAKLSAVLATGVFYFTLALGYQLTAVLTNRIVDHETGRSNSPQAGAWYPDILDPVHMTNTSIFPAVNDFQTDLIFKAIANANNCYIKRSTQRECSIFYAPRVEYTERHNASCPFKSHMCLGSLNTAYELDTGWRDANILGINDKDTCQIRSHRVCSPLNIDGYIRTQDVHESGTKYVEYMLGDGWGIMQQGNKTFGELVRDPLRLLNEPAEYLIREVKEDAIMNPKSPRQLIPELHVQGSRVTLFFVRPVNLDYTQPSSDPVFPATLSSGPGMANGDPLYRNPLQRSTAFACADTFTIRHPKHDLEWKPRYQHITALQDPRWKNPDVSTSLHILNITHLAPSYFFTRYSDMSAHFNAPRRVGSFYSAPLDKEQWKLEAKKVYNTDLALLQYHTLGVAQGLGYDLPLAKNLLEEFGIDAKGRVLFPAPGSKNIKVFVLLSFLGACFACWILTIEIKEGPRETTLLITVVLCSVINFLKHRLWSTLRDV